MQTNITFKKRICYICAMEEFPIKLASKLSDRKTENTFRSLPSSSNLIDFSSNDYLGFSKSDSIYKAATQLLFEKSMMRNGATGSRLLSGNHELYNELEQALAEAHEVKEALVYNSGYDANLGLFATVPQRGDIVFYDELIHASIRDGIKMGNAKNYKFKHNDLNDLRSSIERSRNAHNSEIYIVTESVFSMDGDSPDLKAFVDFCNTNNYNLIVDEAHAVGTHGTNGTGLVQKMGLQQSIFARIITFGKAMGCHGAAILGSAKLKEYQINFSRSFIYTTGLPPHSVATIIEAYQFASTLPGKEKQERLFKNISLFNLELIRLDLGQYFIPSNSAIHCCVIAGNDKVKSISKKLMNCGFDVKPIMSPTVESGKERLRFCLHSYNTEVEISTALQFLKMYL